MSSFIVYFLSSSTSTKNTKINRLFRARDLKDIIVRSDIWKDKFYYIFRNETIFNGCMGILMPIRNQVIHSRGKLFDEQQIKALEVNYSVKKFNL